MTQQVVVPVIYKLNTQIRYSTTLTIRNGFDSAASLNTSYKRFNSLSWSHGEPRCRRAILQRCASPLPLANGLRVHGPKLNFGFAFPLQAPKGGVGVRLQLRSKAPNFASESSKNKKLKQAKEANTADLRKLLRPEAFACEQAKRGPTPCEVPGCAWASIYTAASLDSVFVEWHLLYVEIKGTVLKKQSKRCRVQLH